MVSHQATYIVQFKFTFGFVSECPLKDQLCLTDPSGYVPLV